MRNHGQSTRSSEPPLARRAIRVGVGSAWCSGEGYLVEVSTAHTRMVMCYGGTISSRAPSLAPASTSRGSIASTPTTRPQRLEQTFSGGGSLQGVAFRVSRLASLPSPYETITFYYGIYSSSYRGKKKIIAFIANNRETKKILKHIGEETERATPLPSITIYAPEDSYDFEEGFPHDEVYSADGESSVYPQGSPCPISGFFKDDQKKSSESFNRPPIPPRNLPKNQQNPS